MQPHISPTPQGQKIEIQIPAYQPPPPPPLPPDGTPMNPPDWHHCDWDQAQLGLNKGNK